MIALCLHGVIDYRRHQSPIIGPEMTMISQQMVAAAAVALCLGLGAALPAAAQSYPDKPIRIMVPAGPGGPTDIPARLASQILSQKLGQPAVIEYRPGAAGVIAGREFAKASPDGYTLLSAGTAVLSVIPAMSTSAGYDPVNDFAPVAEMMDAFQILVVNPSSPWKSVKELVEDGRANPGKLNYAHIGTAHLTHLAGELFMSSTGTKMVGVPYRGSGESVAAVMSHAVDMTFENVTVLLPLIRAGKLRALAVTSRTRTPLAPDLPTMIEAGVADYEVTTFFGLLAPAGTPKSIVKLLNATLNEALATSDLQQTITNLGALPQTRSPAEFGATIADNLAKWKALGKTANIKID
jgi:tripartite-type tricarboxylate transporter receptor subunit TctC